jgi:hypothetical protein
MRRGMPALLSIFALALAAQPGPALAQAGPTSTRAAKKQVVKARPRIPIPGVGGAAPPRKHPATAVLLTPGPMTGPLLPRDASKFPATVLAPGSVPGLPGLPGLQAREINPLIFGLSLPPPVVARAAADQKLSSLLKGTGATNVRFIVHWSDIEKVKGTLDWQATDRSVRILSRLGLPLIATLDSPPAWATQPGVSPAAIAMELERLAGSAGGRYKSAVNLWELFTEPDLDMGAGARLVSGPGTYGLLLQAFSRGIKRSNPVAQVAVGGLAVRNTQFLADLYRLGSRGAFDAVALHPSVTRDVIDFAWLDAIRALMVEKGDTTKPVWITDWGWSTATGRPDAVSELHQARLIRQTLAGMRDRPYVVLADYRSLLDWRQRESDPASLAVTGIASATLQPKPGYLAFHEMATGFNPDAVGRYARVSLVGALPLAEEAGVRGTAVQVQVDASKPLGPMERVWEGLSQDYDPSDPVLPASIASPLKALRTKLVRFDPFPNPDWVQTDRILVQENGRAPRAAGEPTFTVRWQYADAMMDSIAASGANAVMNIATMPSSLSSPVGNPRMPRDMAAWSAWVRQVVRRYSSGGRGRVAYWELSSEPNRGDYLLEEWLTLYQDFARAVVAADPRARVGGPSTEGFDESWLKALAERCDRDRIPLHFLSWHALGQSSVDCARQAEEARAWLRPPKNLVGVELLVSEWNPNTPPSPGNDSLVGAARIATTIESMLNNGPDHALFYSLRDASDPRHPSDELIGRFGLLSRANNPKAAYNLFRLLAKLGPERVPAASEETDIHAVATRSADGVTVLLWSDPTPGAESERSDLPVFLRLKSLPWKGASRGEQWILDPRHGDISTRPSRAGLESAGSFTVGAGDAELPVIVSPRSITLIELRPAAPGGLELSLEAPRYVVYGGPRVGLAAKVRNPSAQARRITLTLGGRDLAAGKGERIAATVGPNETKVVPFSATVDPTQTDGQCFFTVTASTGESATTSVKLASPLVARLDPARTDVPPIRAGALVAPPARFKLLLENRSDRLARVGVAGGATSVSVSIPPRQTAAVPVLIPVPSGATGVFTAPVRIIQGTRITDTLTASVSVLAASRFATTMPRVNGDLAEWGDAEQLPLTPAMRDRRGSFSSLSAHVMTMWDDHALYVAVAVTDSDEESQAIPVAQDAPVPGLRLSVQEAGATPSAAPVFRVDLNRTGERLYRETESRGPGRIIPEARVAAQREGRRTLYEVSIPWSELGGATPRPGQRVAFAVRVNDVRGRGRPGLEYANARVGDAPANLPALVLRKP